MHRSRQLIASAVVSLSLVANSTVALAASAEAPSPPDNAWLALSMLSPSASTMLGSAPAASVCGAAAAAASAAQPAGGCVLPQVGQLPAAQPVGTAPAPAPYVGSTTPPLPVILFWLAVIGVDAYLVLHNDHHGHPNSPT
jgi:hypothetical protein